MSISYQPKDSAVQAQQLKVQELVVKLADKQLVSVSGSDVTISIREPIASVSAAMHLDNSVPDVLMVAAADIDLSVANEVTLTLSAPLAAEDCIILKYVVSE